MTEPNGMLEEEIRRALRTAGDLVVPVGDGLHKIRERTVYRRRPLAWLFAYAAYLLSVPFVWLRVVASELTAAARGHSSLGPGLRSPRRWPRLMLGTLRAPGSWLRPALSATAALLIVIAIAIAVPRVRNTFSATFSGLTTPSSQGQGGGQANGAGPGAPQSSNSSAWPSATPTPGQPFDATMPPGVTIHCQSMGVRQLSSVTHYGVPPAPAPGITQTVGAGVATLSGNAAVLGPVGPKPGGGVQTASCTRTTRPPVTMPPSVPPTPPTTTPPTIPVTTPVTTPAPTTTPPTTTPVTTPPTTTPPPTSTTNGTSSPSGSASPG
jgi:hypothetical protein